MQRTDPKPDTGQDLGIRAALDDLSQGPVPLRILQLARHLQDMIDAQMDGSGSLN